MKHQIFMRVYYEDTDLSGVVYYANYLKFIERARSEWVRSLGIDQKYLKAKKRKVFAVRHLVADYVKSASFDDVLEINTFLENKTAARFTLKQDVLRGKELLFRGRVTLVAIKENGKPTRLPAEIRLLVVQPNARSGQSR